MTTYKNPETEMERLLAYVLESEASDLHLVVGKPPIVRVDSNLLPIPGYAIYDNEKLEVLISTLLNDNLKKQFALKLQVDFSYEIRDRARFRVNVYYQKGTWAASLRHIPQKIRTLAELNLPPDLEKFTKSRQGLVLFVGPTGHGKSTSMAALIDIVNHSRADHIITIEDPIEYIFIQDKSIISQREVYQDTPNFPLAIRATLREDVNVVMVGEMRDLESIATTLTVAETGHLVLATLHTNDAAQTADRIVDVFPPHQQNQIRSQLANVLLGVVSQRLLPRIGGGRVCAMELMFANNAVRNLIREGRSFEIPNVIQTAGDQGMWLLDRYLSNLVKQGLVKLEDALYYSLNPDLLRSLVRRF